VPRKECEIATNLAASQDKTKLSFHFKELKVAYKKQDSKVQQIEELLGRKIMRDLYESSRSYYVTSNFDDDYPNFRNQFVLCQGCLKDDKWGVSMFWNFYDPIVPLDLERVLAIC